MLMYAVGVCPLVSRLKDPAQHKQNWYADDSSCGGRLVQIKAWFTRLLEVGPSYGYFAEPAKSILVVKERHLEQAKSLFVDLQVQVVLSSRFLEVVLVLQMVSANTCPARLTRGSNVLNDLPKLQEPTHNLPILPLTVLSPASGHTCSVL